MAEGETGGPPVDDRVRPSGDAAVTAAFRAHAQPMYRLARFLVSDEATADDIVQDVFLKFYESPERYDPTRGTVLAYLLAVCRGRALDVMRAERARTGRQHRATEASPAEQWSHVEDETLQEEVRLMVGAALGRLPSRERDPILLAFYGGHSYERVADLLGEPEGTVKSRIRSGMVHLRDSMVEFFTEELRLAPASAEDGPRAT